MKRNLILFSAIVVSAFIINACGSAAKEIPMENMAKIIFKMAMDKKLDKEENPATLENSVIEPYVKAEGFTVADFKYTAELIDKDADKNKKLGEMVGKMMLDEMLKALGGSGSDLGKMFEGAMDSSKQGKK